MFYMGLFSIIVWLGLIGLLINFQGFKLHFHFSPNEYFKNAVLTKSYDMKCEMDSEDPFSFEGPEIIKCTVSLG